jgi:hypothetical protein
MRTVSAWFTHTVQQGGGEYSIAVEDAGPLLVDSAGGDQCGPAFIAVMIWNRQSAPNLSIGSGGTTEDHAESIVPADPEKNFSRHRFVARAWSGSTGVAGVTLRPLGRHGPCKHRRAVPIQRLPKHLDHHQCPPLPQRSIPSARSIFFWRQRRPPPCPVQRVNGLPDGTDGACRAAGPYGDGWGATRIG